MGRAFATIGKSVVAGAMVVVGVWLGIARQAPGDAAPPVKALAIQAETPCDDLDHLIVPVRGIRLRQLADTFGDARSEGRRHDAIDIMAPRGTPVLAAASGRIEKLFLSRAGGNTIYLRSPDGRTLYYYAHLDRYMPDLREGETVLQGAEIGEVGYSGNANPAAPHLHFAISATEPGLKWWQSQRTLNPFPYLTGARDTDCD